MSTGEQPAQSETPEANPAQNEEPGPQSVQGPRINVGLVIVNTGNGKGKTTAALGVALRAWGRGLKVIVLQFIKHSTANFGGEHFRETAADVNAACASGQLLVFQGTEGN